MLAKLVEYEDEATPHSHSLSCWDNYMELILGGKFGEFKMDRIYYVII